MNKSSFPPFRLWRYLLSRWSAEDYPGAKPRFQLPLFGKDLGLVSVPLVIGASLAYAILKPSSKARTPSQYDRKYSQSLRFDSSKSQIIDFQGSGRGSPLAGIPKRSPGTLIKLRLMNVVETFSTAPVYAQIIDTGLGQGLLGGTLIGDANPDPNFERINMTFRFARDPGRDDMAAPISARALSLDGTLGIEATKKDGYFTRSAFSGATGASQGANANGSSVDLKDIILRAFSSGFLQEFESGTQVEKNRSQVLTLQPDTEFFAELTDFFPGSSK